MNRTIHAVINDRGQIKPQKPLIKAKPGEQLAALIVVLGDQAEANEELILSEPAFAREWSRPEEDAAWQNLDQALL